MAEELGDKTEAPTPRRRVEARQQGNIPRSADLTSAVILIGALLLLKWYGEGVVEALKSIMDRMLGHQSLNDFSATAAWESGVRALIHVGRAVAPLFIGAMLIAILINLFQVGLNFNLTRLQPNLGGLNPFKGIGKLFKGQSGVQLIFNMIKLIFVSWIAWTAVGGRLDQILAAQALSFTQIFLLGASLAYSIGMRIGIFLLILAIIDYAYQKWRVEQELKMTKQEVKEDMKRMDGDPKIKARRRQLALKMLTQKLKKEVPTADVVVTNPTHYAIALKYDTAAGHAPRVIAKGQDFIAQRIREIAIEAGVPIIERPPLARALYATVDVGAEIPEKFYAAVAEILAYVYELTGKNKKTARKREVGVGV